MIKWWTCLHSLLTMKMRKMVNSSLQCWPWVIWLTQTNWRRKQPHQKSPSKTSHHQWGRSQAGGPTPQRSWHQKSALKTSHHWQGSSQEGRPTPQRRQAEVYIRRRVVQLKGNIQPCWMWILTSVAYPAISQTHLKPQSLRWMKKCPAQGYLHLTETCRRPVHTDSWREKLMKTMSWQEQGLHCEGRREFHLRRANTPCSIPANISPSLHLGQWVSGWMCRKCHGNQLACQLLWLAAFPCPPPRMAGVVFSGRGQ